MTMRLRDVVRVQAAYYIGSGIWPLLSRRSFEAVTGPKTDWWLVQTVALLVLADGAALAVGSRKKKIRLETLVLALASNAVFTIIDTAYVAKRVLRPVYLSDAAVEFLLAAATVALYLKD